MGNCLSTPAADEGLKQHVNGSPGHYKAGKNAHDSVHSMDTAGCKDSVGHSSSKHKLDSQQSLNGSPGGSSKTRFGFGKGAQQSHSPTASHQPSSAALSTAGSSSSSNKKRKPPGVDISTGQPIPDLNVNGVLDVLHELGSGGSGTTYLCRDMAEGKVGYVMCYVM